MENNNVTMAGFRLAENLADHVQRQLGEMHSPVLLVAGSTVRGDFLQGWSDLDILVYYFSWNHYHSDRYSVTHAITSFSTQSGIHVGVSPLIEGERPDIKTRLLLREAVALNGPRPDFPAPVSEQFLEEIGLHLVTLFRRDVTNDTLTSHELIKRTIQICRLAYGLVTAPLILVLEAAAHRTDGVGNAVVEHILDVRNQWAIGTRKQADAKLIASCEFLVNAATVKLQRSADGWMGGGP